MVIKISFLLCISFVVASAHPAYLSNDIGVNQLQSVPAQNFGYLQQAVGDVAQRASNAYVATYDQQKNSLDQTFENVKATGQKGIESTLGLLKNGLEFIFFLPRFGRNALAPPQSSQQQLQQYQQYQRPIVQQQFQQKQNPQEAFNTRL